eukprot:UN01149
MLIHITDWVGQRRRIWKENSFLWFSFTHSRVCLWRSKFRSGFFNRGTGKSLPRNFFSGILNSKSRQPKESKSAKSDALSFSSCSSMK